MRGTVSAAAVPHIELGQSPPRPLAVSAEQIGPEPPPIPLSVYPQRHSNPTAANADRRAPVARATRGSEQPAGSPGLGL